ncbi:hypothetical protein [Bacillus subtilis]|uniref:hypothetical protein n=1 Tax=Bacillus subtilis TaxID=1423 RepID=UPI000EA315B7|nr:hypothetical protein [Bacillus subtilis]AYF11271.1 hypothetical protein D3Z17_09175 [Bacillus subtilis]MCS4324214.1 hypothetical protein [Bacillus subtilis]NQE94982.1 hypothetical protein [Bacillus subtilis]WIW63023.1 hypothetical protein LSG27_12535 [Bacillus subtilis]
MGKFKKTLFSILGFVLILSSFTFATGSKTASASEKNEINSIQEYQDLLLVTLKISNPQDEEQLENAVDQFNSKNEFTEKALTKYYVETNSKTILPNVDNPKKELDIDKYIQSNVDIGQFTTHKLNENISVTFTNTPVYFIESTIEEETPPTSSDVEIAAAKYKNTKTYTHSYTAKNFLNMKLFTVKTKGYFQYNGNDVKPKLNDAWYTRGFLSIWQVSNWQKSTYKKGSNYAEVYGRGNFHFGLEINGYGLVVQDQYIKVYLTGNKKGTVYKKTSVK